MSRGETALTARVRRVLSAALGLGLALPPSALRGRDAAFDAEIQAWRDQREARLRAEDGWLAVAGLFWLKEGPNRFGTDPSNEIVLPPGSAPARAGVFELREGKATARLEPGVEAAIAGTSVSGAGMRPDTSGSPDVLALGRLRMTVIERGGRYGIRLRDPQRKERLEFTGLSWFPIREEYRVVARFVPYDPPRMVRVPNVIGQVNELPSPGYAVFVLRGRELRLDPVLEEPDADELFFIFSDRTSGKETYGAGRFLYAAMPRDGTVVLDFNRAYSPPCAFTPFATCPLPPSQNRLPLGIEAGEKSSARAH